jgi:hypothetical protein
MMIAAHWPIGRAADYLRMGVFLAVLGIVLVFDHPFFETVGRFRSQHGIMLHVGKVLHLPAAADRGSLRQTRR